jgi:hypothetical protein
MSADKLGPQVLAAVKFLQHIYLDLESLVQHADKVFADEGWAPTVKNNVFARLGNRLNPRAWLLTRLYRCYAPKAADGTVDRAIAIVPALDPPAGFDEPICLACHLSFSQFVKPASLTRKRKWLRTLPNEIAGLGERFALPNAVVHSLLPHARRIDCVVAPLCDLTGGSELVDRLLTPVLALANEAR